MPSTRDMLVDAAEQIVRGRGLDALTIRTLAAETNYGKSTVHSTVGGIGALTQELRSRAGTEVASVAISAAAECAAKGCNQTPDELDEEFRLHVLRAVAAWIIENPRWAEACFHTGGPPYEWRSSIGTILRPVVPAGLADLDEADRAQVSDLAAATVRGVLPMVVAVGDPDYGAGLLDGALDLIVTAARELVSLRTPVGR